MASATQKGVENPRRAALEDIVKNRKTQIAEELKEGGATAEDIAAVTGAQPEVPTEDPRRPKDVAPEEWSKMSDEEKGNAIASAEAAAKEAETDGQRAEREAKEAEAKAEEERKAAEAAAVKTEKLKIDGQEQDVDVDKIMDAGRRALQKEMAADKRLEEAAAVKAEAERLKKVVEDAVARLPGQAAAQPAKTPQEMVLAKEGLRDIVKKIQYGSEDEAAAALEEYGTRMAQAGQTGRLTETELNNILDLREAQKFVKTNYADVMGDANLKELFVVKVNRKLAAGDARPYQEICKETGDELRTWKAPAKPEPTPPAGGRTEAALQRKTTTVSIPAAGARLPSATPETKAPTQAELIQKAREARGQA